ncbi:Uncharacterized protein CXorf65-like protein [Trichoplax sp. H2]|nr:Uncharacterized protein CXorf65-like protein [Trichoplax sp. H2]|eukprot:RDD41767.1 Uncharacterized protein CXorf65-like protein [Trichoplax sp. H2]
MFIKVRYSDSKEVIVNPNCRVFVLLESLKKTCSLESDVTVDLSDEEGNVKFLSDSLNSYANEHLNERSSYILIRVQKSSNDTKNYVPLLIDDEVINEEFLARLQPKITIEESASMQSLTTKALAPQARRTSWFVGKKSRNGSNKTKSINEAKLKTGQDKSTTEKRSTSQIGRKIKSPSREFKAGNA